MKKLNIIGALVLLCAAFIAFKTKENSINPTRNFTNNTAGIKTVVVLGNSIVQHAPNKNLGWNGNWGMAASTEDKDFVHLLIKDIKAKNPKVVVKYANVTNFERNYTTYDLAQLDEFKNADMLILKLSENVPTPTAVSDNFVLHYDKLVKYLAPKDKQIKVIMDGFFNKPVVNGLVKSYAEQNKYPFVQISDLSSNPEATAKGLFENKDVANHPSDYGMSQIEKRLWEVISNYF
jgi:hypothetical protein